MSATIQSSRLAWLAAAWSDQRSKIARLLGRMGDLGSPGNLKPRAFTKFLNLMSQVASAKDEEVRLISEIEDIERRHKFCRKQGWVKRVGADNDNDMSLGPDGMHETDGKRRTSWLWIAAFWYAMTKRGITQK